MTQQPAFFVLEGGLDQTTQAIAMPRGRVIAARNFESSQAGYTRITGYERYDGHPSPTAAGDAQSNAIAARTAREAARALIQQVPGSGPVRGVLWYDGQLYAWRDNADQSRGVMYRASPTGWQQRSAGFRLPFASGGSMNQIFGGDTITGATSGASTTVWDVTVTSGTWGAGTAAGYLVVAPPTGVFAATENLNRPGTLNIATKSGPLSEQFFPPGGRYLFVHHNFFAASNTQRAYGVNGVGQAFEMQFDGAIVFIATGTPIDTPTRVAVFKQQLFLAFPGGSLQHSAIGEPLNWSGVSGAAELGAGDEITDLMPNTNALTVLCASSVLSLVGNDNDDFELQPISDEAGAVAYTAQRLGSTIYLDNRGLRSITATAAYGNFQLGTLAPQIQATLDGQRHTGHAPLASCVTRTKDLYRLFYSDGTGISLFFGRKRPEPMLFDLGRSVTCIAVVDDPGVSERTFFGSGDGYVFEMDVGTSLDGSNIIAFIQLPFNHEGQPWRLKRWSKVVLELLAAPTTQIRMLAEFDYSNDTQPATPGQLFDVRGGGALWSSGQWSEFYWSAPVVGQAECWITGQGRNISIVIASFSDDQPAYTLQGMTTIFSLRGQSR